MLWDGEIEGEILDVSWDGEIDREILYIYVLWDGYIDRSYWMFYAQSTVKGRIRARQNVLVPKFKS